MLIRSHPRTPRSLLCTVPPPDCDQIAKKYIASYDVVVVPSDHLSLSLMSDIVHKRVLHGRGALVVTVEDARGEAGLERVKAVASRLVDSFGFDLVGPGPVYTREVDADVAFLVAVLDGDEHRRRTLEPTAGSSDGKHQATLVGIVKDEADLAEWVAYHAAIGFDAAVIYDHGSAVPVAEVLAPLAEAHGDTFSIRVVDWNIEKRQFREFVVGDALVNDFTRRHFSPQQRAYAHFLYHYGSETEWAAFFDADEFLSVNMARFGGRVDAFLAQLRPTVAAVAVEWVVFGSNGHVERPPGLIIEAYTRWGLPVGTMATDVKHLVRTAMVERVGTHSVVTTAGQDLDVWGNVMGWSRVVRQSVVDPVGGVIRADAPASLFHYRVKSRADFVDKKVRGGGTSAGMGHTDSDFFQRFDTNDFEDRRMVDDGWAAAVKAWLSAAGVGGVGSGGGSHESAERSNDPRRHDHRSGGGGLKIEL